MGNNGLSGADIALRPGDSSAFYELVHFFPIRFRI